MKQYKNSQNLETKVEGIIEKIRLPSLERMTKFTEYDVKEDIVVPKGRYVVDKDIVIKKEGGLKIASGTEFYFKKDAGIVVYGYLQAKGTGEERILFSSYGDVWKNISIFNLGDKESELEYCDITKGTGRLIEDLIHSKNSEKFLGEMKKYDELGGGILIIKSNPLIQNCDIYENQAFHGGGMYICKFSKPPLEKTIIEKNKSKVGGGIYILESAPQLKNGCYISQNEAEYMGGGICASRSGLSLNKIYINSNSADSPGIGGGIYLSNSELKMNSGGISKNNSKMGGGGAWFYKSIVTIENSVIEDNITKGSGGGLYARLSDIGIENAIIENNEAKIGGGMCIDKCDRLAIRENLINYNTAEKGGGVFHRGSEPKSLGWLKNKIVYLCGDSIKLDNNVSNNQVDNIYGPDKK